MLAQDKKNNKVFSTSFAGFLRQESDKFSNGKIRRDKENKKKRKKNNRLAKKAAESLYSDSAALACGNPAAKKILEKNFLNRALLEEKRGKILAKIGQMERVLEGCFSFNKKSIGAEPIEDIEERLVIEWQDKAKNAWIEFLSNAKKEKKQPKNFFKKALNRPIHYDPFAFILKERIELAKTKTIKEISKTPWQAKLATVALMVLIFSISFVCLNPNAADRLIVAADNVWLYPMIKSGELTLDKSDSRAGSIQISQTSPKKPLISREDLAAYIIKNRGELSPDNFNKNNIIKVSEEDLRGKVAGVAEER